MHEEQNRCSRITFCTGAGFGLHPYGFGPLVRLARPALATQNHDGIHG
jgi:hypothetical protein